MRLTNNRNSKNETFQKKRKETTPECEHMTQTNIPPGVILPRKLDPNEKLVGCDALVGDFWAWAFSDLLLNIDRAVFAEFIVGYALGVTDGKRTRRTWDCVDHEYKGKKIEVKATGFAQRWRQGKKRSPLSFDIAKRVCIPWGEPDAERGAPKVRSAGCYIFCIHTEKDAATANPLDLHNWKFLVISTEELNRIFGDQQSVLCSILREHCTETDFDRLSKTVDTCIGR